MSGEAEQKAIQQIQVDNLVKSGFFDDLLELIRNDEYDREVMPHYGMIPDFYLRWRDLKDLVKDKLNQTW